MIDFTEGASYYALLFGKAQGEHWRNGYRTTQSR